MNIPFIIIILFVFVVVGSMIYMKEGFLVVSSRHIVGNASCNCGIANKRALDKKGMNNYLTCLCKPGDFCPMPSKLYRDNLIKTKEKDYIEELNDLRNEQVDGNKCNSLVGITEIPKSSRNNFLNPNFYKF